MNDATGEGLPKNGKELIPSGSAEGVQLYRYKYPNGLLSGVLFPFHGGIITARHVAQLHNLQDFNHLEGDHIDLAYKKDLSMEGLPLGFVNKSIIRGAKIVTSSVGDAEHPVVIYGDIGPYDMPTTLSNFIPVSKTDSENVKKYIQPGASGSPIIYNNHIIGIISFNFTNPEKQSEVPALVFKGFIMKEVMSQAGMDFESIE